MVKCKKLGKAYFLVLMAVVIAATAGCAPASNAEPAVEPATSPESGVLSTSDGSGLSTAIVTQEATPTSTDNEGESDIDDEQDSDEATLDVVTPVVVDLDQITPDPSSADDSPQEMPQPGLPDPAVTASSKAALAFAERLGIDVGDVQVISVEEVEWSDSSLGCPKAGQSYLTVMTPGYRIILEANGERAEFHADTQGRVVSCEGNN